MNCTTIEQSRKLIELGLKPETADLCYVAVTNKQQPQADSLIVRQNYSFQQNDVPAWSVEALLEAMPQSIHQWDDRDRCYKTYELNLFRSYYHCCSYSFGPSLKEENHDNLICYGGDTWIEAVYNVVIWCFENNHIKSNNQK